MKFTRQKRYPAFSIADRGFTLLEVLVAMVLLSVALAAILELFSTNLKALAKSDDVSNAVILAELKMREILDDETLIERAWSESTGDKYRIDIAVRSTENNRTENLQIKLFEINLTVLWTKDAKEKTVNLKTLKVVAKQI
ncbi:MAG: type II secretion system protein [Nitrospirae bacterium]|nr:type II secretion system protein [Nitrospirota bacterium]